MMQPKINKEKLPPNRLSKKERDMLDEYYFLPGQIDGKEKLFVLGWLQGLDPKEAMQFAGYSKYYVQNKTAEKRRKFQGMIAKIQQDLQQQDEPPLTMEECLQKLERIIRSTNSDDKTRMQAIEKWLKFTGAEAEDSERLRDQQELSQLSLPELQTELDERRQKLQDFDADKFLSSNPPYEG